MTGKLLGMMMWSLTTCLVIGCGDKLTKVEQLKQSAQEGAAR